MGVSSALFIHIARKYNLSYNFYMLKVRNGQYIFHPQQHLKSRRELDLTGKYMYISFFQIQTRKEAIQGLEM